MSVFRLGDRVYCLGKTCDAGVDVKGQVGTVCDLGAQNYPHIGVRWDEYENWKHTCDHNCEDGHGWYVHAEDLELIGAACPEEEFEIEMSEVF